MAFYPKLDESSFFQFKVVVENMLKDEDYLKADECPYPPAMKDFFMSLRPPEVSDVFSGDDDVLVIEEQIQKIINDLESMSPAIAKSDPGEKMNYFKIKAALYDKLISMQEKTMNLKEINEFRNIILEFMHESLTKDQITALMHRLDGIMGINSND